MRNYGVQQDETSSNPIPLTNGEISIPTTVSTRTPVWYSVELEQNDELTAVGDEDFYFDGTLYKSDDLDNEVAYAQSELVDATNYIYVYKLTYKHTYAEPAKYLLKVTYIYGSSNNVTITITKGQTDGISAITSDGNFSVANGIISGGNLVVFDLQGRKVFEGVATQGVSLTKGVYIVNGKKIIVK